jgi:hypothetical protein
VINRRVNSWQGVGRLHFTNIRRMIALFSVSNGDPSWHYKRPDHEGDNSLVSTAIVKNATTQTVVF